MSKLGVSLLAVAILTASAACGHTDEGPPAPPKLTVDEMSARVAEAAATDLHETTRKLLWYGPVTYFPLFAPGAGDAPPDYAARLLAHVLGPAVPYPVYLSCNPTQTGIDSDGVPIDSDRDGIPDDFKIDFGSHCSANGTDVVRTFSGSLRVRDIAGFFAYRLDAVNLVLDQRFTNPDGTWRLAMNAVEEGSFTPTSIRQTLAMSTDLVSTDQPKYWSSASRAVRTVHSTLSYAPSAPIVLGAPVPPGPLTLSADEVQSFSDPHTATSTALVGSVHFTYANSAPIMASPGECNGPTGGALEGRLVDGTLYGAPVASAGVGFTVTWNGCGNYTVRTHGPGD